MNQEELKDRTKQFALRVTAVVEALPNTIIGRTFGNQLIRAGSSVGANYRAACRGRSRAEFIAKLGIVIEEADESAFWLELIAAKNMFKAKKLASLIQEAYELVANMVASRKTAMRQRVVARKKRNASIINHQSSIINQP